MNLKEMLEHIIDCTQCISENASGRKRLILQDAENTYRFGIIDNVIYLQDITEDVDEIYSKQVDIHY